MAVATLWCASFTPRALNGMVAVGIKAFDGDDRLATRFGHGRLAGTNSDAIQVHRARTAQALAAAELRAGQSNLVADDPEQRHCGIAVIGMVLPVDLQCDHHSPPGG